MRRSEVVALVCEVCEVCENNSVSADSRCSRCGWELRDQEFLDSLNGLEEERYLRRRDLARARWKEFRRYDASPREGSSVANGMIIRVAPSSSAEVAIGGSLL
jgi:hypothetical protein